VHFGTTGLKELHFFGSEIATLSFKLVGVDIVCDRAFHESYIVFLFA